MSDEQPRRHPKKTNRGAKRKRGNQRASDQSEPESADADATMPPVDNTCKSTPIGKDTTSSNGESVDTRTELSPTEFDIRWRATRLFRRGGESVKFLGDIQLTLINDWFAIVVRKQSCTLAIRCRPIPCPDEQLRASLAVLPREPSEIAEFTYDFDKNGIAVHASIDLSQTVLRREEMQMVRSELELRIAKVRRAIEEETHRHTDLRGREGD